MLRGEKWLFHLKDEREVMVLVEKMKEQADKGNDVVFKRDKDGYKAISLKGTRISA